MKRIFLTGASGLVGSVLEERLAKKYSIFAPSHQEFDVTKKDSVLDYVGKFHPDIIIHAAAYTNATEAEHQRGDQKGMCWNINVTGTKNIQDAAKRVNAYHIFISTGSVFAGSKDNPGPFDEDDKPPQNSSKLSWYGWTKKTAEELVDGPVLRLSHPIKKDGIAVEKDYLHRCIALWDNDHTYPFYTDQFFPITSFGDLTKTIECLIETHQKGIYHVVSPDMVSPYELVAYALKKRGKEFGWVKKTHLGVKTDALSKLGMYHAMSCQQTQEKLGIQFNAWKAIVDEVS